MKTRFTQKFLMAFLAMGLFTASHAQTYVNSSAAGANDGSSWADAYTDLGAALEAADGDVWIAAGTYIPAGAGLESTFEITEGLSVYGGFAGTEASIDERVPGNPTILSGDVDGNDTDNVFDMNKEDNVAHVVSIDAGADVTVTLDGLIISGGNAGVDSEPDDSYLWAGAGVYSVSTVNVTNCSFDNHQAASGSGIYILGDGNGSVIDNCTFEKSTAPSQSAGAMANSIDGFTVTNSTFRDNTGARGALYPLRVTGLLIDGCSFINNVNAGGFGGAMFIWSSVGTVSNSFFDGNSAGNAAGIYNDGRERAAGENHITFDGLVFENNSSLGNQAAGIQTFNSSHTMMNCVFENNTSIQIGAAHLDGGEGQTTFSMNNTFKGNESMFGGAQAFFGEESINNVSNNVYDGNVASTSGGAIINAFGPIVTISNSYFEDNLSDTGSGGAIYNQNDTTQITVDRCQFVDNTSNGGAGVMAVAGPIPASITNSYFEGNTGDFGGAISANENSDGEFGEVEMLVSNCIFTENFAGTQGAGMSIIDIDTDIINCVFSANTNSGTGAGGALSLNSTDTSTVAVNVTHCTIASNIGAIGSGIATFTGENDSKLTVTVTNTILANPDLENNYQVEDGTPKLSSGGGNISTDATTEGSFSNTNDMSNVDSEEIFEDISDLDFSLVDGSPATDNGVEAGIDEDIFGNARVGVPDAGAYESVDPATSTEEVLENNGQLTMYPNPAANVTTVTIANNWTGVINASVTDMTGKVVSSRLVNKPAETTEFTMNVSTLSEGNYILTLRADDQIVSTQFVKI